MKNYRTRAAIQALDLVAAERARQVGELGWTADHDDMEHKDDELTMAAIAYAMRSTEGKFSDDEGLDIWPWDDWGMKGHKRESLVKAAALLLAALEQDLRPELKESQKQ